MNKLNSFITEFTDNNNPYVVTPFPYHTPIDTIIPLGQTNLMVKAIVGSGGWYLSNEIHYRISALRETINNSLMTGHLHVGFLNNRVPGAGDINADRGEMLSILEAMFLRILINNL